MSNTKHNSLAEMVSYVSTDEDAFIAFVDYLKDEYLDEPERSMALPFTATLSRVANALDMSDAHAFTDWYQREALGYDYGQVKGMRLNDLGHRLRITTVFILEDIFSEEIENIPEELDAAIDAHFTADDVRLSSAIMAEFDLPLD